MEGGPHVVDRGSTAGEVVGCRADLGCCLGWRHAARLPDRRAAERYGRSGSRDKARCARSRTSRQRSLLRRASAVHSAALCSPLIASSSESSVSKRRWPQVRARRRPRPPQGSAAGRRRSRVPAHQGASCPVGRAALRRLPPEHPGRRGAEPIAICYSARPRMQNAPTALALPARPAVQIAEARDRQVWVVSASLTGTPVAISLLDAKGHAALGDMVAIVHA